MCIRDRASAAKEIIWSSTSSESSGFERLRAISMCVCVCVLYHVRNVSWFRCDLFPAVESQTKRGGEVQGEESAGMLELKTF